MNPIFSRMLQPVKRSSAPSKPGEKRGVEIILRG
jgi:hypothetical protein